MNQPKVLSYCKQLVKQHDFTDYCCSLFLPSIKDAQNLKFAISAFNIETGRIANVSLNNGIKTASLQYWMDSVSSITDPSYDTGSTSGNPILNALKAFIPQIPTLRGRLLSILASRKAYLSNAAIYSMEELEDFCERSYSTSLYILLNYLEVGSVENDHIASHIGKAMGITSFLRTSFPISRCSHDPGMPMDLLAANKISQQDIIEDTDSWRSEPMKTVVHQMADTAMAHVSLAEKHLMSTGANYSILQRLFLPLVPTKKFLDTLQSVDFDLTNSNLYLRDRWLKPGGGIRPYYAAQQGLKGRGVVNQPMVIIHRSKPELAARGKRSALTRSKSTQDATKELLKSIQDAMHSRGAIGISITVGDLIRILAVLSYAWFLVFKATPRAHYAYPLIMVVLLASELLLDTLCQYFSGQEVFWRLASLQQDLQMGGFKYGDVKEPPSRAIRLSRVHRDKQWRLIPTNLLVTGDIVQISPGERELSIPARKLVDSSEYEKNLWHVSETLLGSQLEKILDRRNIRRNWWRDGFWISDGCFNIILALSCFLSTIHMVCSQAAKPLVLSPEAILLATVLSSPLWPNAFSIFGSARLIALVDILQKSKTPYTKAEDDDEFDEEAPPPMKDVTIRLVDVFNVIKRSARKEPYGCLLWTTDLVSALSSVSVLSFLDREGPISNSFPLPLEMVIPNPHADEDFAFGEFIVDPSNPSRIRTNYASGQLNDDNVRALCLSLMVTTSCGIHEGQFRRDWHDRFPWNVYPGRPVDPVFRTCSCGIAREAGFTSNAIKNYSRLFDFWIFRDAGVSVTHVPSEYQGLFSRVFLDRASNTCHMFSFGDLTSATCLSDYTWNSKSISRINPSLKKKLIDFDDNLASSDLQCLGITYKPIMSHPSKLPHLKNECNLIDFAQVVAEGGREEELRKFAKKHIFLGALISGYEPKEDLQELIDDLENYGIRFVYFSPYSESVTKAYGKRLGLETDWNSCIILSHPAQNGGNGVGSRLEASNFSDPKSKIPRGVYNIRPHLENVDDIPLHISLFAECETASIIEMLKVYNEYEERVVSVGSTLNWTNGEVFANSLLSIGMEPAGLRDGSKGQRVSSTHLSAALTSLYCPFILPFDCSPYVFTEIIREARTLFDTTRSFIWYRSSLSFALLPAAIVYRASINPLALAWLVVAVLLSFILFPTSPYDPDNLKRMPKILWSREERKKHVGYFILQIFISSLSAFTIAWISSKSYPELFNFGACLWVSVEAASFMHDHLPIWEFGPLQNKMWALLNGPSLCITFLYSLFSSGWSLDGRRVWKLVQLILAILASLVMHEAAKARWQVIFDREQKRAKLLFNTKLGMHSPV